MIRSIIKTSSLAWDTFCRWFTISNVFESLLMTTAVLLSMGLLVSTALVVLNLISGDPTHEVGIFPSFIVYLAVFACSISMFLTKRIGLVPVVTSTLILVSVYLLYWAGFIVDKLATISFLVLCLLTMLILNISGRYFSFLQVLSRLVLLALLSCLICIVSIKLGTCSELDAVTPILKKEATIVNKVLSWLPDVAQKFSCNTLPNALGGIVVALVCALAVLYPVSQRGSDLAEFHRNVVVELTELSKSSHGAAIDYVLNVPIDLSILAKMGIWLFLIFGIVVYVAIPFGPIASAKALSLILLYIAWLGCELTVIHFETHTPMRGTPLRTALHLLLHRKIKNTADNVNLIIDSESKLEEVYRILSEHLKTTRTVVIAEGKHRFLPILLGFHFDYESKELVVCPLTSKFELPSELMVEFKTLLTKRLNALKSNSHANKLELHALFREAVYADTLSLLPRYFEKENTQLATAAYLTICAEHITKRIMPGWITIVTHLPELSVTTGSLLKHLYVSNLDWPFIAEADIDVSGLFDTDLNKSPGTPEEVTCIMAEPDIKS